MRFISRTVNVTAPLQSLAQYRRQCHCAPCSSASPSLPLLITRLGFFLMPSSSSPPSPPRATFRGGSGVSCWGGGLRPSIHLVRPFVRAQCVYSHFILPHPHLALFRVSRLFPRLFCRRVIAFGERDAHATRKKIAVAVPLGPSPSPTTSQNLSLSLGENLRRWQSSPLHPSYLGRVLFTEPRRRLTGHARRRFAIC